MVHNCTDAGHAVGTTSLDLTIALKNPERSTHRRIADSKPTSCEIVLSSFFADGITTDLAALFRY